MSPDAIGWDPDDAPELDDAWFERGDISVGGRLVQRGYRPGETERLVLPTEMVERFRAGGPGWQLRIEAAEGMDCGAPRAAPAEDDGLKR